ncbi:hypothetical protein ColTof4_01244 [Colletotrichum tofieldiae]|nr:hypothetical protein ColTof3_08481 [Colletotrichum tofieldiae]GKT68821.1 hypothetical protein ColTof4_01244 [Colletotrichum tofieldiae]
MATQTPASATIAEAARLRTFVAGADFDDKDVASIVNDTVLVAKAPFNTTHKVIFTSPDSAHEDVIRSLLELHPHTETISFILTGGFTLEKHWSARQIYLMDRLSFFDQMGEENDPGCLVLQLNLSTGLGVRQLLRSRVVTFTTSDADGRSMADLYIEFFMDRLESGIKWANEHNGSILQRNRAFLEHNEFILEHNGPILNAPNIEPVDVRYTIDEDDSMFAIFFGFGFIVDTARSSAAMENNEDMDEAEMRGGSGLNKISIGSSVEQAWGDLQWLVEIVEDRRDSIMPQNIPTVVTFIPLNH